MWPKKKKRWTETILGIQGKTGIFESLLLINGLNAPKSGAVGQWNVAETSERAAISELWEIKEEIQFRVTSELKNTLNCLVAIFAVQEARGRHFWFVVSDRNTQILWSGCLPHIILFPWETQLWDCLSLLVLLHFGFFFLVVTKYLNFWSPSQEMMFQLRCLSTTVWHVPKTSSCNYSSDRSGVGPRQLWDWISITLACKVQNHKAN